MYASHGLGLAAPQIDVHKRLTVIDTSGGEADVEPNKVILINPEIIHKEGKQTGEEGCLSIPGFLAKTSGVTSESRSAPTM